MRVFALIKKDIFLVKKYLLIILAISVVFPIFIFYNASSLMGVSSFLITVIFSVYMALQSVSLAETKYPKAEALLCSTPYIRKYVVIARYLFFLMIFTLTTVIYQIVVAFLPDAKILAVNDITTSLLIGSILLGVYLPLQYKLGYEKMKYLLMIIIMLTPFSLPYIVEWLSTSNIDLSFIDNISAVIKSIVSVIIALVFHVLSIVVSIKIYNSKEL